MPKLSLSKIDNPGVAKIFEQYPPSARRDLKNLRKLIIQVGRLSSLVGPLEETLKWGEPSYLTPETKSGSTVRIDWKISNPLHYGIYFKCTSNLIVTFKRKYPSIFNYQGTRCIHFKIDSEVPEAELKECILLALTYHKNKHLPDRQRWEFVRQILDESAESA